MPLQDAAFIGGRRLYHFLTLFMWCLLEGGIGAALNRENTAFNV